MKSFGKSLRPNADFGSVQNFRWCTEFFIIIGGEAGGPFGPGLKLKGCKHFLQKKKIKIV
jgi:hypothetical protein